jgi:hypothetical protein
MSTVSSSLLDLILDLLSNDDELKRFEADPEKFVAEAGYEGCEDDVKDAVKMAGDMRSHSYGADKVSPATRAEHTDYQAVSHVAPAHATHYAPKHEDRDDHKDHKDYEDREDHKDYDGPRHVEHVTNNHDVDNITNHHYTTNNIDKSHYGDTYGDIEAEGDVVLPGGFHAGEDNEYEGDFEYKPENSFNEATVGGDGVAAANGDVDLENAFNDNHNEGSGVLVGGDVDGDVNNNHADDGSIAGNDNEIDNSTEIDIDADIDASTSDDDTTTIIKDNVAQFGENNINDAGLEGVNIDTNASAAGGEEAEVEEVLTLDVGLPELAVADATDPAA